MALAESREHHISFNVTKNINDSFTGVSEKYGEGNKKSLEDFT
jgi:hypothetical protein